MKFIELTQTNNKPVLVNVDWIVSLERDTFAADNLTTIEGTEVVLPQRKWEVKEDYEHVKQMIERACEVPPVANYIYSAHDDMQAVRRDCGLQS